MLPVLCLVSRHGRHSGCHRCYVEGMFLLPRAPWEGDIPHGDAVSCVLSPPSPSLALFAPRWAPLCCSAPEQPVGKTPVRAPGVGERTPNPLRNWGISPPSPAQRPLPGAQRSSSTSSPPSDGSINFIRLDNPLPTPTTATRKFLPLLPHLPLEIQRRARGRRCVGETRCGGDDVWAPRAGSQRPQHGSPGSFGKAT